MNRLCLTFLALSLCIGSRTAVAIDHTKDSIADIQLRLKEKKAILLDVREQKEWDEGHLKGAVLLPKSKIDGGADPKELVKDLKKDTIIYCHCKAGRRALAVAEILSKQGYDVRALKPGYEDLLKAGFEKADDSKAGKPDKK